MNKFMGSQPMLMATLKKRIKKRKKEYKEIINELVPPFEPLAPKKVKRKKGGLSYQ